MNLAEFRQAQEAFAQVVVEAMNYGPDPGLSEQYRKARAWMQAHYREHRSEFGRLWTTSSDPRRFPGQHTDPFENLLAHATLDGLLKRDARHIQRDLEDIETAFELCKCEEVPFA